MTTKEFNNIVREIESRSMVKASYKIDRDVTVLDIRGDKCLIEFNGAGVKYYGKTKWVPTDSVEVYIETPILDF